ncbi:hypothetical protein [Croceimicrobium hydrocarbonivorans]|uniref:Lipocalin-like domain-containing protein n=1 Tax=Croceimicrobium hydrocarbonivorans TaxID=2761580 RepID=A0A7H0VHF9_9FLAO|nr:hypothetical protein [Croceimicrobium hydrocarbonivorans]QNR25157.1 hypothetical protein H4K34_04780 [Croceimicrobium hydrocarbonivorans]
MRPILSVLFLFFMTTAIAQEKLSTEILLGCWTDSREESTIDFNIFRPCDYKEFPISRYRFMMVLEENQECQWLYLSPNDAHSMVPGTWKFDESSRTLSIFSSDGKMIRNFELTALSESEMKIKKS